MLNGASAYLLAMGTTSLAYGARPRQELAGTAGGTRVLCQHLPHGVRVVLRDVGHQVRDPLA